MRSPEGATAAAVTASSACFEGEQFATVECAPAQSLLRAEGDRARKAFGIPAGRDRANVQRRRHGTEEYRRDRSGGHGKRGNFEKSGLRFSKKAFLPSLASSVR